MDTSCFVTLFNHHTFDEKISNPPSTMLPKVSNHSCSEAHKATATLNLSLRVTCLLLIYAQISFTNEGYRPFGNQRINHADLMQDKIFQSCHIIQVFVYVIFVILLCILFFRGRLLCKVFFCEIAWTV